MIIYSAIGHGGVLLVSHQKGSGAYEDTAGNIFKKLSAEPNSRVTYASQNFNFHCVVNNGMVFVCAADLSYGKHQAYTFLAEIQQKWDARPGTGGRDFSGSLAQTMETFSSGRVPSDRLQTLNNQVSEVKSILTQNIEKVLERGERLDDLMAKTEDLEAGALQFRTTGRRVARKMWWKNIKMMLILGIVVGGILLLIILLATGVIPTGSS